MANLNTSPPPSGKFENGEGSFQGGRLRLMGADMAELQHHSGPSVQKKCVLCFSWKLFLVWCISADLAFIPTDYVQFTAIYVNPDSVFTASHMLFNPVYTMKKCVLQARSQNKKQRNSQQEQNTGPHN